MLQPRYFSIFHNSDQLRSFYSASQSFLNPPLFLYITGKKNICRTEKIPTTRRNHVLRVWTSKYVLWFTITPVFSRPGPDAVTLSGSPDCASTPTTYGLLGISRPAKLTITRYIPGIVGTYTQLYVRFRSLLKIISHCQSESTKHMAITFSHHPFYPFSINGSRHFFSVNLSPYFTVTSLFSPYTLSWTP